MGNGFTASDLLIRLIYDLFEINRLPISQAMAKCCRENGFIAGGINIGGD
jgi:hypothetical protein